MRLESFSANGSTLAQHVEMGVRGRKSKFISFHFDALVGKTVCKTGALLLEYIRLLQRQNCEIMRLMALYVWDLSVFQDYMMSF